MAFIQKKDPIVLNIKLTNKGRELLSRGELEFKKFVVGDSEIDYNHIRQSGIEPTNISVLRPVDRNPRFVSAITRLVNGDRYNDIDYVPTKQTVIKNEVQPIGFFNIDEPNMLATLKTTGDYVKQPDAMVHLVEISGGTILNLYQAPTYQASIEEPSENDILMVRWTGVDGASTTGYTINMLEPKPILFYRIEEIVSGSLSGNDLVVRVDRELPNFNGLGSGVYGGAVVFEGDIEEKFQEQFSVDYVDEAVLVFLENCQCPTIRFPFWNLSILFTEDIIGVKEGDLLYGGFDSNLLAGFVTYIQNQEPTIKKLGVIHYTNQSPSNVYGEQFNMEDGNLKLEIPTVMWHDCETDQFGVCLSTHGSVKTLQGLNTRYYDLVDPKRNVLGKVFIDLKLFVIEDQELLFAMSYKSNRNWTLPKPKIAVNTGIYDCPICEITFDVEVIDPCSIPPQFDVDVSVPQPGEVLVVNLNFRMRTDDPICTIESFEGKWKFENDTTGEIITGKTEQARGGTVLNYEITLPPLDDGESYIFTYGGISGETPTIITSNCEYENESNTLFVIDNGTSTFIDSNKNEVGEDLTHTFDESIDMEIMFNGSDGVVPPPIGIGTP